MTLFLFTFAFLAVAFAAMGLGAALGRAPLTRGCGRLGDACEGCARPCPRRGRDAAEEPRA